MKIASLCVLSYKRKDLLDKCLNSLFKTIDYPCEIIVNDDGDKDSYNSWLLADYFHLGKISKLILNNGENRGVGRSLENCIGISEGEYIFKIDADLTFHPHWLSTAIRILEENMGLGAIGLFDYNLWDPNDSRFKPEENVIEDKGEYKVVKDFVSSIYGIHRLQIPVGRIPDDGFHQRFGTLALKHMVDNTAFGVNKSTYVSGTMDHPFKTPTHDVPLIFNKDNQSS